MNPFIKFINDLYAEINTKINDFDIKYGKNSVITYDRTITTSLFILNIINFKKKENNILLLLFNNTDYFYT